MLTPQDDLPPAIDLAPERLAGRRARRRRFVWLTVIDLLAVTLVLLGTGSALERQNAALAQRIQQQEQAMATLERRLPLQLSRDPAADAATRLHAWLAGRCAAAEVLALLARVTPPGVALDTLIQQADGYVLTGQAVSTAARRELERTLAATGRRPVRIDASAAQAGERRVEAFRLRWRTPAAGEGSP